MSKTPPQPDAPNGLRLWLGLGLLLALGVAVGAWLWSPSASGPVMAVPSPSSQSPQAAQAQKTPPTPLTPNEAIPAGADLSLREGAQLEVEVASLPADRPSVLHLRLSDEQTQDFGVKSAWLYREEADPLEISVTRTGPNSMETQIPPGTLKPGRAIVELRTDEMTPLPLRRFALQVR